ncbi:MAG TPA: DNA-3-methyladenine glycosylase [Candidatus Krumholzibacteriaceae bacterium]|nr:DNA-3-methyladenine glycosylase [Candidatus Krumholzibacteriaceae bacterium]
MKPRVLTKRFYARDTAEVARDLLGKKLVRRLGGESLEGLIVETEAYYGVDDPASRAYGGRKRYNAVMFGEPGRLFVYNVHRYWMLNFVAHEPGKVGGVLIRALEPVKGVEAMMMNRPVKDVRELTSGPGKLALALEVDKILNGCSATGLNCPVHVLENRFVFEGGESHRVGVKADLPEKLRFYVNGNRFVSR